MDTRFQESLQTQLLYLKQENTQGLSSSGAGTGEPRGDRGERAWGRRGLRRSRNALVACKRCTLRANSACAQVPKTVLMCARSHEMHLSKTLTDVFTEDLLCSREPGQQQGGLGPGGPLSGRQPGRCCRGSLQADATHNSPPLGKSNRTASSTCEAHEHGHPRGPEPLMEGARGAGSSTGLSRAAGTWCASGDKTGAAW